MSSIDEGIAVIDAEVKRIRDALTVVVDAHPALLDIVLAELTVDIRLAEAERAKLAFIRGAYAAHATRRPVNA